MTHTLHNFKAFAILVLLPASAPSTLFAETQQKDILFCTKDIDLMQSSPGFVTSSNPNNPGNIDLQAYFPLENNQHNTFNLRHCFVAFAKVEKKEGSILNLRQVQTYGYGASPNPHEYKKTGGAYEESGLDMKVVSCVTVFNSSTFSNPRDIRIKWANITETMDDETEAENYNTVGHNCCSVAYYAVEKAGGDLSQVNPTSFNVMGMGITWGQAFGNITDYLSVSTFNGIQFLGKVTNFSSSFSGAPSSSSAQPDPSAINAPAGEKEL